MGNIKRDFKKFQISMVIKDLLALEVIFLVHLRNNQKE